MRSTEEMISRALVISAVILALSACTAPAVAPTEAPEATEAATTTAEPTTTVTPTPRPQSVGYPAQADRDRINPAEFPGLEFAGGSDMPWWNDRVFYEIFVRSFYDSDGDGVGDLQGVIEKLDYLNDGDPTTDSDLGVTGIWLMPIMDSPSYHGYDVIDYYNVNPDYGTNEDFKELMAAAHERGIVVIVDLVLNHTSVLHPWFQAALDDDPDYDDWYVWSETDPGFNGPWGQNVWHRVSGGDYYYGVFVSSMPDLNYRNPAVTEAMGEVSRYWLEDMGADGFRLDAIKHMIEDGRVQEDAPSSLHWLYDYNDAIDEIDPNALTVGEVWSPAASVVRYTVDGVDVAFTFDYAGAIIESVNNNRSAYLDSELRNLIRYYPANQYATFLANHDQNRVMNQLGSDVEAAKAAATILLTGPGVPFIYYGEEIGMQGSKPDERIRTPMHWTDDPINAGFSETAPWQILTYNVDAYNVELEDNDPDSLLNHYRELIALRNEYAVLRLGDTVMVDSSNPHVFAMLRYIDGQVALVIVNLNTEPVYDFTLTVEEGPLTGGEEQRVIFGNRAMNPVTVNEVGGFTEYRPSSRLDAREAVVILFE